MTSDYLVVALVCGIAVSYLAIIHHFWLRDAFKEEASLDLAAANERKSKISHHETFSASKSAGYEILCCNMQRRASKNNTAFGGGITAGVLARDLRPAEGIHRDSRHG
jgi:predicted alpha/beta hydrolase